MKLKYEKMESKFGHGSIKANQTENKSSTAVQLHTWGTREHRKPNGEDCPERKAEANMLKKYNSQFNSGDRCPWWSKQVAGCKSLAKLYLKIPAVKNRININIIMWK